MPDKNRLSAEYDVLIVGGGIAGATLGAEIAAHARTLLIEAEDLCGYHSTGRSAAFWLESYGGPVVAQLTAASRPTLKRGGFLRPRGALHVSPTRDFDVPEGVETREVMREELEQLVPGIRPQWQHALMEPGCSDIDVARLHSDALARYRRAGGELRTRSMLQSALFTGGRWTVELADGATTSAAVLVNAAGAWADSVARAAGVQPLGIVPKRRTMVQLRVGRAGLRTLPLVSDAAGTFYFKGEGDSSIWLSPHDEIDTVACDAAPEEIDVATAIDRFQQVVDWPVERAERSWAGLRSFAPDRIPVYGYAVDSRRFFWCVGQGGFGIQTAPAAARLAAALLLETRFDGVIDWMAFAPSRF